MAAATISTNGFEKCAGDDDHVQYSCKDCGFENCSHNCTFLRIDGEIYCDHCKLICQGCKGIVECDSGIPLDGADWYEGCGIFLCEKCFTNHEKGCPSILG